MTPESEDPLVVERVTTGRRAPLAVAILTVVLAVGLLAWKPWDAPINPPDAQPAAPTPSQIADRPTVSFVPRTQPPTPMPTTPSLPTPTLRPTPGPGYRIAMRLIPSAGANVQCRYDPDANGMINVLSSMAIGDTFLYAVLGTPKLDIRRVTWRAIVQVNRLETLFSANWETVWVSRRRVTRPRAGEEAVFFGTVIPYRNLPTGITMVARVEVKMAWFGPDHTLLGSDESVAPIYSAGESLLVEGCHVFSELPV